LLNSIQFCGENSINFY